MAEPMSVDNNGQSLVEPPADSEPAQAAPAAVEEAPGASEATSTTEEAAAAATGETAKGVATEAGAPVAAQTIAQTAAALLEKLDRSMMKLSPAKQNTQFLQESIFKNVEPIPNVANLIDDASGASAVLDGAIGAVVGLAIADSLGHPLEFVDVDEELPPYSNRRPHMTAELRNGRPIYHNEYNRFDLCAGQWTDDNAMALCMADSLLVHRKFNGSDMRVRWFNWWFGGYNNAFRFSEYARGSCGLGGNIAKSLEEVYVMKHAVPAEFSGEGEDAGNGSIMRLAPVPVAYHHDLAKAEEVAVRQSKATHPGNDASACCRFMTFFIITAMHARRNSDDKIEDVAGFIQRTVDQFLETHPAGDDSGMAKLHRLLLSSEPVGSTERNWNWKEEKLCIAETMKLRQRGPRGKYNGYPVIPSYFGSYCMDGLAMALWSVSRTKNFHEAVLAAVNLLGDADTVGAIAGQMAGAIYGYKAIKACDPSASWLECLYRWDRHHEIPLRGLLLAVMQPEDSTVQKAF